MRLTIIPADNLVLIDGRAISIANLSTLLPGIRAVQWGGERGEIEHAPDEDGDIPPNTTIESAAAFQSIIDLWNDAAFAIDNPQPPVPPTPDEWRAVLIAHAAARRFDFEVSGADCDGRVVATDRESQAKLIAEFVAIGGGIRIDPSPWKFADGEFASLTNAQMGAVILASRTHIADAFAREADVLAAIAAGTITTKAEIDAAFE